jgi:hypothetical protein
MPGRDPFMTPLPDRALVQLVAVQDGKIERVIQIVTVVGNFVRQIGN